VRILAAPLALALLAGCAPASAPPAAPELPTAVAVEATPLGPAFRDARAIASDGTGTLYVSDAGADLVTILAPDGSLRTTIGGPGTGDYAFLAPAGLDPTNGLVLLVADRDNGRVQRFSNEGRLLESIVVPADPLAEQDGRFETADRGRPVAVASAPSGELFVADERRGVVLQWDERRALRRVIGGPEDGRGALRRPVGLALAPDGRLFVADAGLGAVLVYDAFGEFLRRVADGTAPAARAVAISRPAAASGARLAIVLSDRVLLYDLDGNFQGAVAPRVDQPLVAAAFAASGELLVLTATRVWRVETE
jgi:hypothetical protein